MSNKRVYCFLSRETLKDQKQNRIISFHLKRDIAPCKSRRNTLYMQLLLLPDNHDEQYNSILPIWSNTIILLCFITASVAKRFHAYAQWWTAFNYRSIRPILAGRGALQLSLLYVRRFFFLLSVWSLESSCWQLENHKDVFEIDYTTIANTTA